MRPCVFFRLREPEFFFAQSDTLHKESHVPRERAHGLLSLFVHVGFALFAPVDRVPILTRRYRHIGYSEIFIQLVKCRGTSAAPCTHYACADLHSLVKRRAVKKSVEDGYQRRVCGGIIDGTCHNKAVRLAELRRKLIDNIIKDAFSEFTAPPAGDAAPDIFIADLHRLGLNALRLKNLFHFFDGERSVAVYPRAAVDNEHFHFSYLFLIYIKNFTDFPL